MKTTRIADNQIVLHPFGSDPCTWAQSNLKAIAKACQDWNNSNTLGIRY